MRHRKSGRTLGRSSSHRKAMFRNMVTSFLEEEKIQTTSAKAKELRRIAEKLITLGKNNAPSVVAAAGSDEERQRLTAKRVAAVRQAGKTVRNRDILQKLFGDLAERYQERPGGYTRIMRMGRRHGDNAEMSIIELIPEGESVGVDLDTAQIAQTAIEPEVEQTDTEEAES